MATPTDSNEVFSKAILKTLELNKGTLNIVDLFYSDQEKIAHTPTVCVEPGKHSSQYNGVGPQGRILNTLTVYVLVYSTLIAPNVVNLQAADDLAYRIRAVLHSDVRFGGLVHRSFVSELEPGYIRRPALMRATRITLEAESQTFL